MAIKSFGGRKLGCATLWSEKGVVENVEGSDYRGIILSQRLGNGSAVRLFNRGPNWKTFRRICRV